MNSKIFSIFAFILGAGVGSAVTYYTIKNKYDNLIDQAVEEVKERYSEKIPVEEKAETKPVPHAEEKAKANQQKPNITDYNAVTTKLGYEKKEEPVSNDIQVITKEEFDEGDYNNAFLTYFADGVLINDLGDQEVEKELVGVTSLETFGEGDDPDVIYVRNNKYEIDYEITRVKDNFNVDEYTESDDVDTDYDD